MSTKRERKAYGDLCAQVDTLLNAGSTGSGILNIDVLEAFLWDVQAVTAGNEPTELAQLIERDKHV